MQERPDGSTPTILGVLFLIVGIFAAVLAPSRVTPDGFAFSLVMANLGIGLGVLLCSLGYLAKAIYHLPGREVPSEPALVTPHVVPASSDCEYCGISIAAPAQPCSSVTPEELAGITDRIDDEKCLIVLREKGILKTTETELS